MFSYLRTLIFGQRPQPSSLLSLPLETRLTVYKDLFTPQTIYLNTYTQSNPISEPPILHTSTLLRSEALPIFYSSLTLNIPRPRRHFYPELESVLSKIPHEQMLQIRRFVIPYTTRCTITIQLSPNPSRYFEADRTIDTTVTSPAPNHIVVGGKYYVQVSSTRRGINQDFCEAFAAPMARLLDGLLTDQERKGRRPGLYLSAVDLHWLMVNIDMQVPVMLKEFCNLYICD